MILSLNLRREAVLRSKIKVPISFLVRIRSVKRMCSLCVNLISLLKRNALASPSIIHPMSQCQSVVLLCTVLNGLFVGSSSSRSHTRFCPVFILLLFCFFVYFSTVVPRAYLTCKSSGLA